MALKIVRQDSSGSGLVLCVVFGLLFLCVVSADQRHRDTIKASQRQQAHKQLQQRPKKRVCRYALDVKPAYFSKQSKATLLQRLPFEVREMIWQHVVGADSIKVHNSEGTLEHLAFDENDDIFPLHDIEPFTSTSKKDDANDGDILLPTSSEEDSPALVFELRFRNGQISRPVNFLDVTTFPGSTVSKELKKWYRGRRAFYSDPWNVHSREIQKKAGHRHTSATKSQDQEQRPGKLALLLTCRQIYQEGKSMLYAYPCFTFANPRHLEAFINKTPVDLLDQVRSVRLWLRSNVSQSEWQQCFELMASHLPNLQRAYFITDYMYHPSAQFDSQFVKGQFLFYLNGAERCAPEVVFQNVYSYKSEYSTELLQQLAEARANQVPRVREHTKYGKVVRIF